jgi:hypothetical protein
MKEAVERYRRLVDVVPARLVAIPEAARQSRPDAGKWSKKEILGHLIDSAANNHQRFIRAQAESQSSFPGYAQEFWVSTQQYQLESWEEMIDLWRSYNIHLLHVIALVPEAKLQHQCSISGAEPVTLEFLIIDYIRHLEHHLKQILGELFL